MNLKNRDYLHFDAVSKVYGSRFELKPGFAASALSQLMMTGDIAFNTPALYFKEGDNVRMGPRKGTAPIVTITWNHGKNLVVEWCKDQYLIYYREFQGGRVKLDIETGALKFTNLIASDTGVYTVEINNKVLPQTYNVIVIPNVSPENTLRELGAIVAQHGAFLELTNVRDPSRDSCDTPNPHVWRSGNYYEEHDLTLEAKDARTLKWSGVYVFDELSRRSNNRAGIIVSLPSSAYEFGPKCAELAMPLHRNVARSTNTVMYSTRELSALAVDMAKWGVSKYGLGYLDYTFVRTNNMPTFTVLANAVEVGVERFRTLRYS